MNWTFIKKKCPQIYSWGRIVSPELQKYVWYNVYIYIHVCMYLLLVIILSILYGNNLFVYYLNNKIFWIDIFNFWKIFCSYKFHFKGFNSILMDLINNILWIWQLSINPLTSITNNDLNNITYQSSTKTLAW
jgi:hypothetical protein